MKDIVSLRDVSLSYHDMSGETPALDHMSFSVREGEFVSIVGPSGCGKTSVLSLLAGLIKPASGEITIGGNGTPGYMLQRDHLLDWRDVEGNILLGLEVKGMLTPESRRAALSLLERYGLSAFQKSYPAQLSGGMRQKVALIRTLAVSPQLLLLDEPFSALDFQTRLKLCDEMRHIIRRENKTAILVTHDISEAISMSDRVLVFSGRPARVKGEYNIKLKAQTPLERRGQDGFKEYFNSIWRELEEPNA